MDNKNDFEDEFLNSQTYKTINKASEVAGRTIYEVSKVADDVVKEVDRAFGHNHNPHRPNHPYASPVKPNKTNSYPPPVRPDYSNSQNWNAQRVTKPYEPNEKKEKAKKKAKEKFFLRGLQIFCAIALPIGILEIEPFNGNILDFILAGATVFGTIYLFNFINFLYHKFKDKEPVIKEEKIEEEKVSTGDSELDKVIKEGNEYIKQLKFANDAILHEGISECIFRMEKATKDIFDFVKDHPTKVSQIKKFMNYYLPTTLKLLVSYQKLNNQSAKGENITSTMFNIEGMMQTIASAFEQQLDALFSQEAMDIQADISVFDSILYQEGLKEDTSNFNK
ncbi:MAG: 5-bromo-4-chloroindolyl phosphate hydrolysis family protein [Clostridia bacterium]